MIIFDDPNIPNETDIEAKGVQEFYSSAVNTRFADADRSAIAIIQQRLDLRDLTEYVLENEPGVMHVNLPAEYDPARKCKTPLGEDWRTEPGALLAPKRFNQKAIDRLKAGFPSERIAEAQVNQNPTPADGTLFRREWLENTWTIPTKKEREAWYNSPGIPKGTPEPPHWLPANFRLYFSWDCTFTASETSDYAVGQIWAVGNGNYYLLDQVREKMGFVKTLQVVLKHIEADRNFTKLLIEAKANGSALIDMLIEAGVNKHKIVAINPGRHGKEERAHAVTHLFAEGLVYYPRERPLWWDGYVKELLQFPAGKHDDQVDATTQALAHFAGTRRPSTYKALMNAGSFRL